METILFILGLLGIGIPTLYIPIRNLLFKQNIEFHKLLKSFPKISENRIE